MSMLRNSRLVGADGVAIDSGGFTMQVQEQEAPIVEQATDVETYADTMKDRRIRELEKQLEDQKNAFPVAPRIGTGGGGGLSGGFATTTTTTNQPNLTTKKIKEMIEKHKKALVIVGVCIGLAYVGYRIWKAKNK